MKTSDIIIVFVRSFPLHRDHSDTSCVTLAVLLPEYWLRTDICLYVVYKSVQFSFASSLTKFNVQTSGWTEGFNQVHRHHLILDSYQIPLNGILNFPFITEYLYLYIVVQ
jgi:hypothetical protein